MKRALLLCLLLVFVAGCKYKYPISIPNEPVLIDELELPEGMLEVYPTRVKGGEGVTIKINEPLVESVTIQQPAPDGSDEWLSVNMELVDETWVLPEAILEADGTVRYEGELGEAVRGERKIYTPFFWPEDQLYPIRITAVAGGKTIDGYIGIEIEGSLLDDLVFRPVDPRNPFVFGVTPVWKDHLHLLQGSGTP